MNSGRCGVFAAVLFAAAFGQTALGGENAAPAQFLKQLDQYRQPVAPAAVVPADFLEGRIFIPLAGSGEQKLAIGMNGVGRGYSLQALWLDQGEHLRVLETRENLPEAEYIRRYGNGAIAGRKIPDNILYQGRREGVKLTEPDGFDAYIWEILADDAKTWTPVQSGKSSFYQLQQTADGAQYRCRLRTGTHEFTAGEDYYVEILRLGVIHGIKIVEEQQ